MNQTCAECERIGICNFPERVDTAYYPRKVEPSRMDDELIDVARVSEKGQVVIPKEIRDRLAIKEGTRLLVISTEDAVILQKIELVGGKIRVREIVEAVRKLKERLALGKGDQ